MKPMICSQETEDWIFRSLEEKDRKDLQDLYEHPLSQKDADRLIQYAEGGLFHETIIGAEYKQDGQLKCVFELYDRTGTSCTIGYRCRVSQQGKHFASIALKELCAVLAEQSMKIIHADVEENNPVSEKVLKNAGFVNAGSDGKVYHYVYRI